MDLFGRKRIAELKKANTNLNRRLEQWEEVFGTIRDDITMIKRMQPTYQYQLVRQDIASMQNKLDILRTIFLLRDSSSFRTDYVVMMKELQSHLTEAAVHKDLNK